MAFETAENKELTLLFLYGHMIPRTTQQRTQMTITFSSRRARHRVGVVYIALLDGVEFMSNRHLPDLVSWVQDVAATGYVMQLAPSVTIPAGCSVKLPTGF